MWEYRNTKAFLQNLHFKLAWGSWTLLIKKVLVIKKVKYTVPWTYVISDFNGEEIFWTFYKKESQKTNQRKFRIKKVINRKGDKPYVKWKGFF